MEERDGWFVKTTDPDQSFASLGPTACIFDNLLEAKQYADAHGFCVINEAIQRKKFIVREIRGHEGNTEGVCLAVFPNGPWRVHRRWYAAEESKKWNSWIVLPEDSGAVASPTLGSFDNIIDAKEFASAHHSYLINEAFERDPPKFCVKRSTGVRFTAATGGPWRVHVGPLRIVIGLGCSQAMIHEERIRTCVDVMEQEQISKLLYVGSVSEYPHFYRAYGNYAHQLPIEILQSVHVMFDSQSRTTLGNARFAMEQILDDLNGSPHRHVEIHLVTSEFHLERSRVIFLRAAAVFLQQAGYSFNLFCHPCIHTSIETVQKYIAAKDSGVPTHIKLEDNQRAVYNQHSDEQVRAWT